MEKSKKQTKGKRQEKSWKKGISEQNSQVPRSTATNKRQDRHTTGGPSRGNGAPTEVPQGQKRLQGQNKPREDKISNELLPFAVYIEKFDAKDKVKLSREDFDDVKAGIFNAFWLESSDIKLKLKDDCIKRLL